MQSTTASGRSLCTVLSLYLSARSSCTGFHFSMCMMATFVKDDGNRACSAAWDLHRSGNPSKLTWRAATLRLQLPLSGLHAAYGGLLLGKRARACAVN
jgi:hypothetical protein